MENRGRLCVVYVSDIPRWGGSTLSMKDMLLSLGDNIEPIVLVPKDGDVKKYMQEHGIECHVVPYTLNTFVERRFCLIFIHKIYSCLRYIIGEKYGIMKVRRILKNRHVDVVHSNTSAVDFGCCVSEICGARHVWHVREMLETFENTYSRIGFDSLKRKMECADKLVFISQACRDFWNIPKSRISVVIGDAVRSKRDVFSNSKKEKFFLFCSQALTKFKGADIAIEAFGKSGLANLGYHLKLIGSFSRERETELKEIVKRYSTEGYVDFLGRLSSESIKKYMERATAFLQCSKMEGLGRVSIESMFYGCPVISRANGGSQDYIIDGQTGFIWNTEEELVTLLKKIIVLDTSSIIKKAQSLVVDKYSIEEYGSKILKIYNELL